MKLRIFQLALFFIILLVFQLLAADTTGVDSLFQQQSSPEADSVSDQKTEYPEKLPSRKGWEYAVSAPVLAVVSPVILSIRGIAASAGFLTAKEVGLDIYHILVSKDGTRAIFPIYSSRKGLGLEFLKKSLLTEHSKLRIKATYGFHNRRNLQAEFYNVSPPGTDYTFGTLAQTTYLPDETFYGIGNNTPKSDKTEYGFLSNTFNIAATRHFTPQLSLGGVPAIIFYKTSNTPINNQISTDSLFPDVPGVNTSSLMAELMGALIFDSRDNETRTRHGILNVSNIGVVSEIDDPDDRDPFRFFQVGTNFHSFFEMPWGPYRVLILRGDIEIKRNFKNSTIPYYLLSYLGSTEMINGFPRNRYADNDRLLFSTGINYPVWTTPDAIIDGLIEFDAGQVANNIFTGFEFDKFNLGIGIGARLFVHNTTWGSLIIGFSSQAVTARATLFE